MKGNPSFRITIFQMSVIALLLVGLSFQAEAGKITFSGRNATTHDPVLLDSIYIKNLTQDLDTLLINTNEFDLNWPTNITPALPELPRSFGLSANYPNGFTAKTHFQVFLPGPEQLTLKIHDVLGRQVAATTGDFTAGSHLFAFNGGSLASGIYFIRAVWGQHSQTIKMLKIGVTPADVISIKHLGKGAFTSQQFQKRLVNAGDHYQFIGYTYGMLPARLDEQTPTGGEHFQFQFIAETHPPLVLPTRWRGFNLLDRFTLEWSNSGFIEEDFQLIYDLGFNFVRLPIDYRTYTRPGNWNAFVETELENIDDAVSWGQDYGIHVSINLHRAPGYCVNPPSQPLPPEENVSLWDNASAQQTFANHWRMFAERYQDVPDSVLSFNLVNEPADIDAPTYVRAIKDAILAIRAVSPNRLIISDGLQWAREPILELIPYRVVQSPHLYDPFQITHYRAEWVEGADEWPLPRWPIQYVPNYLYGAWKSPLNKPLVFKGDFLKDSEIVIKVFQVSTRLQLVIKSDQENVFSKTFIPGPGEGEWKEVIYNEQWNCYQNIYDRDYSGKLTSAAGQISFAALDGDWLTFSEIRIIPPSNSNRQEIVIVPGIDSWGVPPTTYQLSETGELEILEIPAGFEEYYQPEAYFDKWKALEAKGIPSFIGEWGVYRFTPHDVTLAFMEDRLQKMQAAGWGWSLWNFRGSFGILDSDRADVDYEDYYGHQLDRKMLELLQKY